jgi:hypothetical protein
MMELGEKYIMEVFALIPFENFMRFIYFSKAMKIGMYKIILLCML